MTSIGSNPLGTLPELQKPKAPAKPEIIETPAKVEKTPELGGEIAPSTESVFSPTGTKKEESILETAKKEIDSSVKEKTTPVSPVKVKDLELAKSGLKKVDTKKPIDRPIPMDPVHKLGAKISEQLNVNPKDKNNLIAFIFDSSKSNLFDKFAEKEFSTENIKFLRDAKTILMNPTLRGLQNLYETQVKDLNVGGTELNAFKKALDSGKLSDAINKFDSVIKAVLANANDTFGRFTLSGGIIQAQIQEKLKPEISAPTDSKEKYSVKDFVHNPKISKAFDDFAKKENSFENVAFLHSAKKMLDKGGIPQLPDLVNLYINFIDSKSPHSLNIEDKDRVAFKTAIGNNNIPEALNALENIIKAANVNASDTLFRFKLAPEGKTAIKQDSIDNIKDVASPNGNLKQVLSDPKKAILFENFAKKEFSSENLNFMKELGDVLKNPDVGKLDKLCKKYVLSGSPQELNLSGVNRKAVTDAIQTGDLTKIIQSFEGAVKDVHANLGDTMSRFTQSPELKENILSPVKSLPLKKQLEELNKMIKSDGIESGIAKTQKKELLEKYVPKMPVTNENGELTKFIANFKEGTKTGLFEKNVVNDITRALGNLEKALKSPESGKEQIQAFDSLKSEVEKFIKTQGNSPKIEFVQALSERISVAKTEIREKFETKESGKLFSLNEGIAKVIPELKFNPSNPKALDEIKSKVSQFLGKDPKGDLAWAVTTLPEDKAKAEISSLVEKSFKNLKPEVKAQITSKIYEGLMDALPIKSLNDGSKSIKINGEEYKFAKLLGTGGGGSVFKYENNKGNAVVVKSFHMQESFSKEAEAHRLVSGKPQYEHENVSKFIGAYKDTLTGEMHTIQEFADSGSLDGMLEKLENLKKDGVLSHKDDILVRQYLAKGIVEGMSHVNDTRDLMQLDVKPENFLYDKKTGTVKVTDFGLSERSQKTTTDDYVGTPGYMSPEITRKKEFDKSSDVWSAGITIDQLMTGTQKLKVSSFSVENEKKVNEFADSGEKFSKVKKTDGTDGGENKTAYGKLINSMLVGDSDKRAKFSELKNNPFLKDPLGSDERAQGLIKMVFDISDKKKRFDETIKIPTQIQQAEKNISSKENEIVENEKLIGRPSTEIQEDISKINSKITQINDQITESKEWLSALEPSDSRVTEYKEKLTAQQKELSGLEEKLPGLNKELDAPGRIIRLKDDIRKLKEGIPDLQKRLSTLQEEFKGATSFDIKAEFKNLESQYLVDKNF